MDNSVPLYILINDIDGVLNTRRISLNRPAVSGILSACAEDILAQCATVPGVQPWLCGAPPGFMGSRVMLPKFYGRIPGVREVRKRVTRGLIIAGDIPTIPPGYLHTAIDAIGNDACSEIQGLADGGGLYLLGWSGGAGKMLLPTWYRILQSTDGITRAKRDFVRGAVAPATAGFINKMSQKLSRSTSDFVPSGLLRLQSYG